MPKKIPKKEIQKRAKTTQAICQEHLLKLRQLKKKQAEIINKFIKELEKSKIEEIKKNTKMI